MKKDVHPKYYPKAQFICECGNTVVTGSTVETYKVEICSACHPFYTGKQKLIDTAGRVEKFNAKRKKAVEPKEEKISETAKKTKSDEKYMTVDEFKAIKDKEKEKAEKREVKKTGGKTTEAKKSTTKKAPAKKADKK